MADDGWPTEWLRALLPLCVLAVIAEQETYGYAIAQRLHASGLGVIKGGTLYPVLNRLEQDGLVTSFWREGVGGPGRKFFAATPAGRAHLAERTTAWTTFTEQAAAVLAPPYRTRPGGLDDHRHRHLPARPDPRAAHAERRS